ncbi:hypothetical protein Tco_0669838 [Tanacetum coccineum]
MKELWIEINVQEEDKYHPFFDVRLIKMLLVTNLILERKSDETEEVNTEEKELSNERVEENKELELRPTKSPSSPLRPIQGMDSEEQHNAAEVLVSISRPRGLSIPGPIQTQPQQPTQGRQRGLAGRVAICGEQQMGNESVCHVVLHTQKCDTLAMTCIVVTSKDHLKRAFVVIWRFEELKKTKPKTTLRKPTSLAQERNQMMSFLKGQGYKNLQKLKYPQMKELYDKVQASIKDSFKDFIPMDSEKEREM